MNPEDKQIGELEREIYDWKPAELAKRPKTAGINPVVCPHCGTQCPSLEAQKRHRTDMHSCDSCSAWKWIDSQTIQKTLSDDYSDDPDNARQITIKRGWCGLHACERLGKETCWSWGGIHTIAAKARELRRKLEARGTIPEANDPDVRELARLREFLLPPNERQSGPLGPAINRVINQLTKTHEFSSDKPQSCDNVRI